MFIYIDKVRNLEYGYISSEYPPLEMMTPSKLRNLYAMNQLPLFDAIATFSSVEHSGLGRYGDALNPWGDLQAIARAWCLAKKNAQHRDAGAVENANFVKLVCLSAQFQQTASLLSNK